LYLLVHSSEFQRSKYLLVFQEVAGKVYSVSNSVQSYLNLEKTNADLMNRIVVLEGEVQNYKKQVEILSDRTSPDTIRLGADEAVYQFIHARVIHNQISETNNYILLDKGSDDGIAQDMAVISVQGIVGAVDFVSSHFSRVIPILNSRYRPSCIIKNTRFSGSLLWDGKDPRYTSLSGLPSHATYSKGDTIITSGYSATFPEGFSVGVVEDAYKRKNEEYNSLKVRLFTDFSTLNEVMVIRNTLRQEQLNTEKGGIIE
jgi:rod shape-determining protein MreC